mgnify:CR=1 FL=1
MEAENYFTKVFETKKCAQWNTLIQRCRNAEIDDLIGTVTRIFTKLENESENALDSEKVSSVIKSEVGCPS